MKRFLLLFVLCFTASLTAGAKEVTDSLWNEANTHYSNAQYQEALDKYLSIEESGKESPALY